MKAIVESLRGSFAIFRWFVTIPLITWRIAYVAKDRREARALFKASFRRILDACRISIVVTGQIPEKGKGCVLSHNETSFADVFAYANVIFPHAERLAAAEIYGYIPFGKKACEKSGFDLVPRGRRVGTDKLMDKVVVHLQEGDRLVWGGEGKLSGWDGVSRFKRGASLIAIRAGVPVVPVTMYGGHQVLPLRSLRARKGIIHVHFGDPISTEGLTEEDARDLADRTQAIVTETYAKLKAEFTA